MGDELNIVATVDGDVATYALEGNLSTISTPYLKQQIAELDVSVSKIVLDIDKLDYASEEGFDYLLQLTADMAAKGGSLVLAHPNEFMQDMMDELDLADKFEIAR